MNAAQLLGRIAENLSVRRAFGEPYEQGGLFVIPVALVAGGGGGGGGEGFGYPAGRPSSHDDLPNDSSGAKGEGTSPNLSSGSGGGFGGVVVPLGVYVVNGEEVRWISAINETLAMLAGLIVVRLLVRRRRRARVRHDPA